MKPTDMQAEIASLPEMPKSPRRYTVNDIQFGNWPNLYEATNARLFLYRRAVREYLKVADALTKIPYEIDNGQLRIEALNRRDDALTALRLLDEIQE